MSQDLEARFAEPDWRTVVGWPEYKVSRHGTVVRVSAAFGARVGRQLKPARLKNGYEKVSLCRDSKRKEYLVHRLVAHAFIGDPTGFDVCHNDGIRHHNHASNLRIDTRRGNMHDTIAHGTRLRGEKVGCNKYTEELIRDIKRRFGAGEKVAAIAAETGIPKPTLWNVKNGYVWKWL